MHSIVVDCRMSVPHDQLEDMSTKTSGWPEGEVLACTREMQDPFAVAVKKDSTIVGHIPIKSNIRWGRVQLILCKYNCINAN